MPKINLLNKETAELIAAGEVVERPASAIKEIIENSIDAGARHITVEIERGGIVSLRVTDDGCGIAHEEVPIAFLRHATSKISTADDLDNIGTLGFRGEALAAISTVAKVQMLTKQREDAIGTRYVIEGGTEVIYEEAGCPDGTTIEIRELFYNTPARMKFLKKDVKEGANVAAVVDRMALSHPEISFRFIRDGKQVLVTQGNGNLQDTVYSVLGREVALGMIPIDYSNNGIRVSGLICKPFKCRPNRNLQIVFLNGRFVRSACVMAALDAGYKNSAMVGKFPYCVINVEVPFEAVDVNVHPAKTEVRFSDESRIFDCVHYGVKNALQGDTSRPTINIHKEKAQIRMTSEEFLREMASEGKYKKQEIKLPIKTAEKEENSFFERISQASFKEASKDEEIKSVKTEHIVQEQNFLFKSQYEKDGEVSLPKELSQSVEVAKTLSEEINKRESAQRLHQDSVESKAFENKASGETDKNTLDTIIEEDEPGAIYIGEIFRTYIIAQVGEKMLLIDKHAAHERIIYENLKKTAEERAQYLLTPVSVTLEKNEYSSIIENLDKLSEVGFDIDDFGDGTVILRAVPAKLGAEDYYSLLSQVAQSLSTVGTPEIEKLDRIYHTVACKAACKAGAVSSRPQLEELMNRVLTDPNIRYCPHGRPVAIELKKTELEKMFGRIQ